MEYRTCGEFGPTVSALGLGCWAFGGGEYWGRQSQEDVNKVVHRSFEAGITLYDTAEAYNEGRSEESLGAAIAGLPRDEVRVCTKIAPSAAYAELVEKHCDDSLRRLGTDYIDLYLLHWPVTPHSLRHFTKDENKIANPPRIEEAAAAFEDLQTKGKVLHFGVSNFGYDPLQAATAASPRIAVNQVPYNLLARAAEVEVIPHCVDKGIGVIGYFALLQGILTGKYQTLSEIPATRRRTRHFDSAGNDMARHGEPGAETETAAALDSLRLLAGETGHTMTELSVAWALSRPGIASMLVGARTVEQLEGTLRASDLRLDAAVLRRLDELSKPVLHALGPSMDYYESIENDRTSGSV